MPRQPILIFPAATVAARKKLPSSYGPPTPRPTRTQQRKRLAGRFQALQTQFGIVHPSSTGVDPEQVIVFETVGSIGDFQNVVKKIPGMEWLGDFDADIADPDPGFLADGSSAVQLPGRLFVAATNRSAFNEVLKLWRAWVVARDEKLPYGFGSLAQVFKHLQDVRPWSPRDRVQATGVVEAWEKGLAANDPVIRFEAQLWCRSESDLRDRAYDHLQSTVADAGGQCITQAAISEIDYHGVLVDLPAASVREVVDALNAEDDTTLLRLTDVKYFSPMPQAAIMPIGDGESLTIESEVAPSGNPIAALLDGLPLANHEILQGRLIIDDPDDLASEYLVGEQRHGTAMASLITRGEIDAAEPPIETQLYVRPILQPGRPDVNGQRWETFPADELPVDTLHRAVRRMFETIDGIEPQAPSVKVINLSVGDSAQLFDRQMSPWARLLDWLAWKYKVLFIVSAGNHRDALTLPIPASAIAGMADDDLRIHTLQAMASQKVQRRLLAPAESVNALTVGGANDQLAAIGNVGTLIDLFRGAPLPSPFNPVASGFRRSIKPDVLVSSGRSHYSPRITTSSQAEFEMSGAVGQPGQLVAASGGTAVPPNRTVRTCGTSNAAALTTRRAIEFADEIASLRSEPGGSILKESRLAVIVKAMLVHGASWLDWQQFFERAFEGPDSGLERWWRVKRCCTQFMGYGKSDFDRGTICSDQRVILLGTNRLKPERAHIYRVPLPTALHAQTVKRRLTITLAWLTPINARHRDYRIADLWFDPPTNQLRLHRLDCDHDAVCRGTIQHEVLEGNAAVAIAEGASLPVQVNCRATAGTGLIAPIPYCLMVTLETAMPLSVSIYEQIRVALEEIRATTRIRPTVGASRSA
jgi:hypothetical protein